MMSYKHFALFFLFFSPLALAQSTPSSEQEMSGPMETAVAIENIDLQIILQKKQNELLNERLNNRQIANRLKSQDKELVLTEAKLDKSINETKSGSVTSNNSINPNSLPPIVVSTIPQPIIKTEPVIAKPQPKKVEDFGSIKINEKVFKMTE